MVSSLKINREKAAALLAAAILALCLWDVAASVVAPRREMKVDAKLPSYSRQLITRKQRVYKLEDEEGYDPQDRTAAWVKAQEWGDRIPTGIVYRGEPIPAYEDQVPALHRPWRPGPRARFCSSGTPVWPWIPAARTAP